LWKSEVLPPVPGIRKDDTIIDVAVGPSGKGGITVAFAHSSPDSEVVRYSWAIFADGKWKWNTTALTTNAAGRFDIVDTGSIGEDFVQMRLSRKRGRDDIQTLYYVNGCPITTEQTGDRVESGASNDVGLFYQSGVAADVSQIE
jgi:hypothetical protein